MIRVDPSDVPCASRRSILPKINRPGTMISPPPTPNSPASRPAPSPMAIATPVVTCPAVGTETAAAFIPPTLRVLPRHADPRPESGADVALGATSAPFFGRDGSSPAETVAKRRPLVGDDRVDRGVAQMARLTGGGRRRGGGAGRPRTSRRAARSPVRLRSLRSSVQIATRCTRPHVERMGQQEQLGLAC